LIDILKHQKISEMHGTNGNQFRTNMSNSFDSSIFKTDCNQNLALNHLEGISSFRENRQDRTGNVFGLQIILMLPRSIANQYSFHWYSATSRRASGIPGAASFLALRTAHVGIGIVFLASADGPDRHDFTL
jgi:hypothetical protein